MQARNWCFTINNYTLADIDIFENNLINYSYCIFGLEKGANGTEHLQGYIEFASCKRFTTIKAQLPKAHLECRKGTQEQAIQYCQKEGEWLEWGTPKAQGERRDLDAVRQLALDGGMRAVTRTAKLQGIKIAQAFLTYNEEPRDWKPEITWIYGPTGVGKSKQAREILGNEDVYTKNSKSKWWDGYDGHENVIIDDFRDSWWDLTEMLSLLDRYEKQIEVKGGMRQFRPKKIVVTSAKAPTECYRGVGENIAQLVRRIDNTIELCVTSDASQVGGNTITPTLTFEDNEPIDIGLLDNII